MSFIRFLPVGFAVADAAGEVFLHIGNIGFDGFFGLSMSAPEALSRSGSRDSEAVCMQRIPNRSSSCRREELKSKSGFHGCLLVYISGYD